MKIKTSYPVIVDGVNKTPDLYYDSCDGEYSQAQGIRRSLGKKAKKKSKPNRPVSTKGTRVVTLGSGSSFGKKVSKALDRPEYYNASGEEFYDADGSGLNIITKYPVFIKGKRIDPNDFYLNADGNGLKVFTTYPIIINKDIIDPNDFYLNADGEEYLPFDGQTELLGFRDELGEEYFCGMDGEDFYNAKGEKLLGAFKSVGKGVVKAGKFIGKIATKVGRAVVEASKKVVSGVKTAGGKIKDGAKALLHHKTKEEKATSKIERDKKRADKVKEYENAKAKREKEIADAKAKGETPPPPLPTLPQENKTDAGAGNDVFTKVLPQATANTPPENITEVAGKKYDATDIPKGKGIVATIDEKGNAIAGVEFKPNEVVAVTGKNGNIEYYTPDAQGMSKGLKVGLIVGGSILLLSLAYFIFKQKNK